MPLLLAGSACSEPQCICSYAAVSHYGGSHECLICACGCPVQTFQKLIFVSGLVFGEQKSAFLLPWRRVFNMTDSQVSVAKRDSAKALFKTFLDARGGHLQARCCRPKPLLLSSHITSWVTSRHLPALLHIR